MRGWWLVLARPGGDRSFQTVSVRCLGVDPIRVVGLAGSLREVSLTSRTVDLALEGARTAGAEVELLDLRQRDIPLLRDKKGEVPVDVAWMREKVKAAHGVILGTPEYHGSYSGVLKNALDWMGFEHFEGKIVGLVAVSGGGIGGIGAMEHLRTVVRAIHGWVVPTQAAVPQAARQFEQGLSEALGTRVRDVGREVTRFAALHHHERDRFLDAWETARDNPGA